MKLRAAAIVALALLASCMSAPERRAVAEEYYNLGNAHLAAGKVQRALALFELAVRADPSLLQAHYNLSLALLQAGRGGEAVRTLSDMLARDPDNVMVLSLLGYAAYSLGRFQEALDRYEQVLARSPGDRDSLYNKALALRKLGRLDDAARALGTVADRAPADDLALEALLRLADLHREAEAWDDEAQTLERYLEWKPQSADALLKLASAYRLQEKYLPAVEAYRRASSLAPEKPEAWMGQAELLLTVIEDPEAGLQALERALQGGFRGKDRLNALLADERLTEKERVRGLVERWSAPEAQQKAPGPAGTAGPAPTPPGPATPVTPATP